jgi:type III secretion protein R
MSASTLLALAALSLVPLLLMAATSFVKVAIVLSLVRNALGAPEVPSGAVITVLAVILSVYVMAPVAAQIAPRWTAAGPRIDWNDPLAGDSRTAVFEALGASKPPLAAFLERNAGKNERALFERLAGRAAPLVLGARDLTVLLPAFLITELKEAFQIGLLMLLPFVIIDLVITNILLALGMSMLPSGAVALPFKLLLFVLVDGWYALSQALISGYQ